MSCLVGKQSTNLQRVKGVAASGRKVSTPDTLFLFNRDASPLWWGICICVWSKCVARRLAHTFSVACGISVTCFGLTSETGARRGSVDVKSPKFAGLRQGRRFYETSFQQSFYEASLLNQPMPTSRVPHCDETRNQRAPFSALIASFNHLNQFALLEVCWNNLTT